MGDIQQGIDPGAVQKAEKAKHKAAPTVKDLLQEFWEIELVKAKSGAERYRLIQKDVLPSWGKRRVSSITRRDAVLLLDKVRLRAPVGANRLQGVLVRMFFFGAERGMIEHSPLTGMRRPKETAKSRVLDDKEIRLFWEALDFENKPVDLYQPTKLALKAILLTGQRPGEVINMRFDQIQDDWWVLPGDVRKNGEENRVPLLPLMREILEMSKAYAGDGAFVFPSSHLLGKPIRVNSLAHGVKRHLSAIGIDKPFTPHDLRRTVRTRLAELGVSDIVGEKLLGHKLQGILAIYNRHEYATEKRQAMQKWETRLREIIGRAEEVENVISFEKRT